MWLGCCGAMAAAHEKSNADKDSAMHFTLDTFSIGNYRSLQDVWLPLSALTVVTGANGSGKSNVFRALALHKAAARGTFAEALAAEGGMPGVLFAGLPNKIAVMPSRSPIPQCRRARKGRASALSVRAQQLAGLAGP